MYSRPKKYLHPFVWLILIIQFIPLLFVARDFILVVLSCLTAIPAIFLIRRHNLHFVLGLMKLIVVATVFLFIISGLDYWPPKLKETWLVDISLPWLRLVALFSLLFCLTNTLRKREIYSFMLAIKVPLHWLWVLFRAFWIVPEIKRRSDEIFLSQQLRGIRLNTFFRRFKALASSFTALFNSLLLELEESSLALGSKGILETKKKIPYFQLQWTKIDLLIIFLTTFILNGTFWVIK